MWYQPEEPLSESQTPSHSHPIPSSLLQGFSLVWLFWKLLSLKTALQEERRTRAVEPLVVTLSDVTSNTYCHKGSYSNTIN